MSKRNHIVERASDVNGGQYIQTNPSYNSGYEDGKKAGKEYCASEISTLRAQVEKLTKERDDSISDVDTIAQHNIELQQQLAALSEQVEKLTKERDEAMAGFEAAASKYRNLKLQLQEVINVS